MDDKKKLLLKRIFGIVSLVIVFGLACLLAYYVLFKFLDLKSSDSFQSFIEGYGWKGWIVALGIQFLQVFVAIIPGEFVEVGMGLAFGPFEGAILCLAGVALASALLFLLVKKWGIKLVELFIDPQKINEFRFINSEKKLNTLVFLLFLIPGTPKDLLTYVVPLTRMKLSEFLCITLIARIPSVVSSTAGGALFGNGNYISGIILLVITGLISVGGICLYNFIMNKRGKTSDDEENVGN